MVQGTCAPRFEAVREEFERNFTERDELGASLCAWVEGEPVVDLWGGDAAPGRAWEQDTVNVVMSCSKGITALCGNMLIDRGRLDPDAPVAQYWPEFGQAGKQDVPVRMLFNHQAGLFTFPEPLDPDLGLTDWDAVVGILERAAPAWTPGTQTGYHGISIGFLIGELVRRVDGRTIGRFLQDEVAGPLGVDAWIGLPPELEDRVAPSLAFPIEQMSPEHVAMLMDPSNPSAQVFGNSGGWATGWDRPEMHQAELPAVGAITNARGLAGIYAPLSLDGSVDGTRLVAPESLARMRTVQSATDLDHVLGIHTTYTMGFSKSWTAAIAGAGRHGFVIGEDAFGTPGLGGNLGFADPSCRLAMAYTMNRHGEGTVLNERGQSLVDAMYRTLGSPGREPGFWIRPEPRAAA